MSEIEKDNANATLQDAMDKLLAQLDETHEMGPNGASFAARSRVDLERYIRSLWLTAYEMANPPEPERMPGAAQAAMTYATDPDTDEGMQFLRLWQEGEFEVLRREWPDAPATIYP